MNESVSSPVGELVYHYCSASTFIEIISNGTVRFSDLNIQNDASEQQWAYSIFENAATRVITREETTLGQSRIPQEFIESVDEVIHSSQSLGHPFIACFSQRADSLDQWRSYADNGKGFSIGFRLDGLARLPVTLVTACYDIETQTNMFEAALDDLYSKYRTEYEAQPNVIGRSGNFVVDCASTFAQFVGLKHPAFASEQEIRCLHAVKYEAVGESFRFLTGPENVASDNFNFDWGNVCFNLNDGALRAYFDMPLGLAGDGTIISEVVVGPRNPTDLGTLFLFLAKHGMPNVSARLSNVPYR